MEYTYFCVFCIFRVIISCIINGQILRAIRNLILYYGYMDIG